MALLSSYVIVILPGAHQRRGPNPLLRRWPNIDKTLGQVLVFAGWVASLLNPGGKTIAAN